MKKNFFKLQQIFFAVLMAGTIVSCDKENVPTPEPEFTPEELAEMAAADKFAAANSVYRALGLLNELPDNWESAAYTPEVGVPVDEANSDIRNVVSTGADHAKSYFLSIVPNEGLEGDTWSHEGVGTLTYRAVNEDNCYAVIDVELVQMPGLKELRFVPESVVGENKWQGTPYYGVGDVVKDKKGIYWICVRPSGGPLAKDNAYFVSFDKSLINTYEYKQDIYNVTGVRDETKKSKERMEHLSGKWVYAKNLVEERIAMSAAFVFAMFTESNHLSDARPHYANFKAKAELLKGVFDPSKLTYSAENENKTFFVAYGSYQSSVKRMTQVKYAQPLLRFTLYPRGISDEHGYLQLVTKAWHEDEQPYVASNSLLSLTDSHDPFTYSYLGYYNDRHGYDLKGHGKFSVLDYTIGFAPEAQFSDLPKQESEMYLTNKFNKNIPLIMTQMSLKDHGKPVSGYELVHVKLDPDKEPNYWGAIESCVRETFEKGLEEKQFPVKE